MVLNDISPGKPLPKRTFRVRCLNGGGDGNARLDLVKSKLVVDFKTATAAAPGPGTAAPSPRLEVTGVSGMDAPIRQLNEFLNCFRWKSHHPYKSMSCAAVLHGGHGTGKTMLLERVMGTGWGGVHRIHPSEKLSRIQEIFLQAR